MVWYVGQLLAPVSLAWAPYTYSVQTAYHTNTPKSQNQTECDILPVYCYQGKICHKHTQGHPSCHSTQDQWTFIVDLNILSMTYLAKWGKSNILRVHLSAVCVNITHTTSVGRRVPWAVPSGISLAFQISINTQIVGWWEHCRRCYEIQWNHVRRLSI